MPLSRTGGAPAPVHPHSHGQFYRGTHSHSRLSHFLYNGSLGVLVIILSCVLLATGYDIFQQVIVVSRGQIRFSDTIVTGGAYVLTFLIASGIIFSRRYTTKRELQAIPKGYIPTGKDELSKNMYRLVTSEFTRCAMIVHATRPTGRALPGWGTTDSEYSGIHFRSAILQTVSVLDAVIPGRLLSPDSATARPIPTRSKHASPLAKYLPLLQGDDPVIPRALLPLLQLYESRLEDARWAAQEPTQAHYEECLRIVAVLVDVIGKRATSGQEGVPA